MIDLCLAAVIWGFSFALTKKALHTFTPFELVFIRLSFGALTGWLIQKLIARASPTSFDKTAMSLGLFEFAGTYIFYTWSLRYLPSSVVGVLTLLTPVFTYGISMGLRMTGFSWRALTAVFLSIFGAGLCLPLENTINGIYLNPSVVLGGALVLVSNLSFSIGNVLISRATLRGGWSQNLTYQGQGAGALFAGIVCLTTTHTPLASLLDWQVWFFANLLGDHPDGGRILPVESGRPKGIGGSRFGHRKFKGPILRFFRRLDIRRVRGA